MANGEDTFSELLELLAANVAADDEIPIWDKSAGQAKKITRANLVGAIINGNGVINTNGKTLAIPADGTSALREAAQTFTAIQTFSAGAAFGVLNSLLYRPSAGVLRQRLEWVTVAQNGLIVIASDTGWAIVHVFDATDGKFAMFAVEGGAGRLIHGDANYFAGSGNTKIMVFGLNGVVYLQNFFSDTKQISVWALT